MTTPTYRSLRRADTKIRLDIEQWPALDKIFYEFLVEGTGEAIAGPFWFGRAFDNPPFFSFSAVAQGKSYGTPELTIGVSEWLRDEQDMYVGAMLWIRFKVCFEPHLEGTDVFDEGFEQILIRTGGGPEGDELPRRFTRGSTIGTQWSWHSTLNIELPSGDLIGGFGEEVEIDQYMAPYNFTWSGPVGVDPSGGEFHQTAIRVSKANPYAGSQHLRITALADPGPPGFELLNFLFAGAFTMCRAGTKESSLHRIPLWKINPGDKVTLDWKAMVSTLDGQDANGGPWTLPDLFIGGKGLHEVARFRPVRSSEWELTTSYQSYHGEVTAPLLPTGPEGAFYLMVVLGTARDAHGPNVPETYFDIDDFRLTISGTDDPARPPSLEVALNFEGVALKGYGNIHKLDPKAAPVKVVLA